VTGALAACVVLLVADGAFCGLRAVVGRTGRLYTGPLVARAMALGGTLGLLAGSGLLLLGVLLLGWPPTRQDELSVALDTLLWGYGTLATLILLGYLLRLVPSIDVRSLSSMLLFGPITLLRPIVIVGVAGLAAGLSRDGLVALLVGLAAGVGWLLGVLLDRWIPRWLGAWL
jgi:hypothetical protein